jgi:uncharacterized protein YciI
MKRYVFLYLMKQEAERVRTIAPDHAAYWKALGLRGYLGGPFANRDGGLITFEADEREDAERAVAGDPFVLADLLHQHWMKEWLTEASMPSLPNTPQHNNLRVPPPASVAASARGGESSRG